MRLRHLRSMLIPQIAQPELLGRVQKVIGLLVEVGGLPNARLGDLCDIEIHHREFVRAEVVGLEDERVILMPFDELSGIRNGAAVRWVSSTPGVNVGPELLGRVVDAMGEPIDGGPPLNGTDSAQLHRDPPNPLARQRIRRQIETQIRALDGFVGIGEGQRIGIFAGSGVGKSVLLAMLARNATSDVNVIALIGERGREVREFIEQNLGPEGLARSVVVVATGNESALRRSRAALVATAIAEWFRDRGHSVLLTMDSVTRVAMAWREVGLTAGEPSTSKGYPPSVFSRLPRLLERSGAGESGTITGLYTVLVDGDDFAEPISDATRSILDGHIVLTRDLAESGHFPAIDLLRSASRVRRQVMPPQALETADALMKAEAAYRENEDLIMIGQYEEGSHPETDRMLRIREQFLAALRQAPEQRTPIGETRKLVEHLRGMMNG